MNFTSVYRHFFDHPEGTWVMMPDNARELYNFVKQTPGIKRVLDLGTGIGCSSSLVALALQERGEEYHIDTIEQYDKCVKLANELIPEEFKKNITIHKTEVEIWSTELLPYKYFSIYKELPGWDYDLIINDGPSPFMENDKYLELPNGTIHKGLIEDTLQRGTFIAWDGRLTALKILEDNFEDNFLLYKPPTYINPNNPSGKFHVLQRKDNDVMFVDQRLRAMESYSYFKEAKGVDKDGKTKV